MLLRAILDTNVLVSYLLGPSPTPPSTQISRDADDDSLYLSARQFGADHHVTGDADLLALAPVSAPVRIVTPAEFLGVFNGPR